VQQVKDDLSTKDDTGDIGDGQAESADGTPDRLQLGLLELDTEGYRAYFDGKELALSASQMELLAILLSNQDRVVSRTELSKALGLARARSVDVILSSLRRELGRDFLRNVRNRGWIVIDEALRS